MQICVKLVKYGATVLLIRSPALFGDEIYGPQPYSGTKFTSLSWIGLVFYGLCAFSPGLLYAVRAFAAYFTRFTLIRCVFHELFMDLPRTLWAWRGFAAYCATWGRSETSNLTPTLGKPQNTPKWASWGHSAEWFWRPSETRLANVNYETFLRIRTLFA